MVQMSRAPAAQERMLTCIVASSYQFRRFVYMLINLVSRYITWPAGTGAGTYSTDPAKAVPLFEVVRLAM